MSKVPTSLITIIGMSPSRSIKLRSCAGVNHPHMKHELRIYMLYKVKGDVVMVGGMDPSCSESIINKRVCINILKISKWNKTFMSIRAL